MLKGGHSQGVGGGGGGGDGGGGVLKPQKQKPPFRPAEDDTKPILRDPIQRSDPIETEQAVLLLPPFSCTKPHH